MMKPVTLIAIVVGFGVAGCLVKPEPAPVQHHADIIRTYAEGRMPTAPVFIIPDIYASELQKRVTDQFITALMAKGHTIARDKDDASSNVQVFVAASLEGGSPELRTRSFLQLAPAPTEAEDIPGRGPRLNDQPLYDGARISFSDPRQSNRATDPFPTLKIRIRMTNETLPVWTGVGHAELDNRSADDLVAAITTELAAALGSSVDRRDIRF